ncbi:helix-turn-helix domain-containing protein [Nonomuraea jiangxiensis]|uniref:helix-turn-helix domain-containing protein n=1 Tax=Nonomuraea jiangxiensis TaxID=633440 RepID=UPI00115FA467|nr:helix-turn-helix domain-containing protein [Nonomuraea jiangxiensis]
MSDPVERVPVAVSDIAALLGVSTNTVNAWRKRAAGAKQVEPFPPAAGKVAGMDYWWSDEILAWATRTGRAPSRPDA